MTEIAHMKRISWAGVSQFEGKTAAGKVVYVRCKNGELSLEVDGASQASVDFGDREEFDIEWNEVECVLGITCAGPVDDPMQREPFLRRAVEADAILIARLFREARNRAMPYLPTLHSPDEEVAFFRDQILTVCEVFVAEAYTLVGFVARRPGWIDHLYVLPDWQRQRVGFKLLRTALSGMRDARLRVFQRNSAAAGFYERMGFSIEQRADGRNNEEREPDFVMHYRRWW
jgi:putative acetyltransferase